jgi:hypothetical protein
MAELTPYSFMADVRYALVFVLSYITLLLERLWNSFWPAVTVVAFYGGIAALGIVRAFPPVAHAVLLFVLTTSFALAALHLGDKFRWPRGRELRRGGTWGCGLQEPADRRGGIGLVHALAFVVHGAEVVLRVGYAFIGRTFEHLARDIEILWHAFAQIIKVSKVVHGSGRARIGGFRV